MLVYFVYVDMDRIEEGVVFSWPINESFFECLPEAHRPDIKHLCAVEVVVLQYVELIETSGSLDYTLPYNGKMTRPNTLPRDFRGLWGTSINFQSSVP